MPRLFQRHVHGFDYERFNFTSDFMKIFDFFFSFWDERSSSVILLPGYPIEPFPC
jgi:hypothetical protein